MKMAFKTRRLLAAAPLLAALAAFAQTHAAGSAQAGNLKASGAWARVTVPGQTAGGAFVVLHNAGPAADRLIGGSTPVAQRVELHEMTMQGDVMKMREIPAIELPAGRSVELKPGGLHLMFMGLKAPMKTGDKVPVTLKFEKAGEMKLELPVQAMPAAHGRQ
ncbi:MAG: copper chaperone PCu(A)C [Pseudomonadota bacterium]